MITKKQIYFFIGTTAELIKLSPVMREMKNRKLNFKIISSNQNVLRFEEIEAIIGKQKADYIFYMNPSKWASDIYIKFLIWAIKSLGNYFLYFYNEFKNKDKKEIYFIVHGDTITALIGAIVARLCRVKLVHIESGLRSYNFLEPFPEEINRFVVSWLTNMHFCQNGWAKNNIKSHYGAKVNTYHNTIAEATNIALKRRKRNVVGLNSNQKYFVFVIHRQEHTLFNKTNTKKLIEFITGFSSRKLKCVFVMHHLTRDYLIKNKNLYIKIKKNANIIMPQRLDYISFTNLMSRAEFIATDGGSNQEEAYYLGLPCLILRNYTERIEGLGKNALLSHNHPEIIKKFIKNYKKYSIRKPKIKISPSIIIVDNILNN